jgi:hypothetical protein
MLSKEYSVMHPMNQVLPTNKQSRISIDQRGSLNISTFLYISIYSSEDLVDFPTERIGKDFKIFSAASE